MSIKKAVITCCLTVCVVSFLCSCQSGYTPKPRGYFRIEFPTKRYQVFDEPGYPYTFEYPTYAKIVKDTAFFNKKPENPWWINVVFPQFNGKIYISYKVIGPKYSLEKLVNDAYAMTYKNTVKADAIVPEMFQTPHHVSGIFYNVSGNAATARQFFATDSTRHFLRGSLYFYAVPNADSLKPVVQFVEKDMWHLLETLQWK
jgi:gliding motility-associated lipoprotein GldD